MTIKEFTLGQFFDAVASSPVPKTRNSFFSGPNGQEYGNGDAFYEFEISGACAFGAAGLVLGCDPDDLVNALSLFTIDRNEAGDKTTLASAIIEKNDQTTKSLSIIAGHFRRIMRDHLTDTLTAGILPEVRKTANNTLILSPKRSLEEDYYGE